MNWFKNRKTVTKLLLGFGLLAVAIAFVGLKGVLALSTSNEALQTLYTRDMAGLSAIKEANINLIYAGRTMRAALLTQDKADGARLAKDLERNLTTMSAQLEEASKTLVTEKGKAEFAKLKAGVAEYEPQAREVMRLAAEGNNDGARQLVARIRTIADQVDADMSSIADTKESLGKKAYEENAAAFQRERIMMLSILIGAVIFALGLGLFLARLVSRPLAQAVAVLQDVAKGDLTRSLEASTSDEIGEMAKALNQAITSMRETMQQVTTAAASVSDAAQQLSSASEELSSGAQEQASSQEETSATMEEIASTVKRNADNAVQANQLASGAREIADSGGEVVSAAVGAMAEINAASKKIADIITAIDEIAFQTNLLALNAAVEAARAGEQGRGFAVVASEVRSLAQRSAASAKEIKSLIQDSVRKVEAGSELVNRSGKTLNEIMSSVKRVSDIVGEIAAASREQATGVDQVGKAMSQMDQVTQQNSAQTEELSSTAESLSTQAEELKTLVAQFIVDDIRHGGRAIGVRKAEPVSRVSAPRKKAPRPVPPHHTTSSLGDLARNVNEAVPQPGNFVEF